MLLFIVFAIIAIISFAIRTVFIRFTEQYKKEYDNVLWSEEAKWRHKHPVRAWVRRWGDTIVSWAMSIFTVCLIVLFILFIALMITHSTSYVDETRLRAQAEVLQYSIDNEDYLATGTTLTQISEYNQKVLVSQAAYKNPWISIFVPEFYNDLPLIKLPKGSA